LRNQISNLRAEVLKEDAEIKDLKEDQQEHLRITSAMQTQIETYFSQLTNAQNSHQQLSSRLTAAENRNLKAEQEKEVLLEELKMACKTKDDIAAMVENLQCRNQELQDRLEEAEQHLQKVAKVLSDEHLKVVQLGEFGEDLARNNEVKNRLS
jgi:septation ring formation regulator EzrA